MSQEWQIGWGQEALQPRQAGLELSGYVARLAPATGVHDPLFARAMVVRAGSENGTNALALICVDVLGVDPEMMVLIRQGAQGLGLPAESVCVAATHTHSAPATIALNLCGDVDPAWRAEVVRGALAALGQALADLKPGRRLSFGTALVPDVAKNRRWAHRDHEPRLTVLAVEEPDGAPVAALVHFACHPVVLGHDNLLISADFPGALVARLNDAGWPAAFCNGGCGDLNPVHRGGFEAVKQVAVPLAEAALTILASPDRRPLSGPVAVGQHHLGLRYRELPAPSALKADALRLQAELAELRAQRGDGPLVPYDDEGAQRRMVRERILQAHLLWIEQVQQRRARGGPAVTSEPFEVHVATLGDRAIAALPAEVFQATEVAIREALGETTMVIGYGNGDIGYLPTDAAEYERGGYEVNDAHRYYGRPAAIAPGEEQRVVQAAVAGVEALRRR